MCIRDRHDLTQRPMADSRDLTQHPQCTSVRGTRHGLPSRHDLTQRPSVVELDTFGGLSLAGRQSPGGKYEIRVCFKAQRIILYSLSDAIISFEYYRCAFLLTHVDTNSVLLMRMCHELSGTNASGHLRIQKTLGNTSGPKP